YHGVLETLGIRPQRSLEDDSRLQTGVMGYHGASAAVPRGVPTSTSSVAPPRVREADCGCGQTRAASTLPEPCQCAQKKAIAAENEAARSKPPDFRRMTPAEKLAYNQARRNRIFGK